MGESSTAFFYGTLMHPKILKRVIRNDGSHLSLCPAILFDFTRHRVKYAQYPGIVPYTKSEKLFKRELNREDKSVRGMLVTGLTKKDMARLDNFEGDEYARKEVSVHPLQEFRDISAHSVDDETVLPEHASPIIAEDLSELPLSPSSAETYVYCDENDLQAELWSYEDFVRENARNWY